MLASPEELEARFYEALQEGDVDKLMAVWSDDDDVVCVHPDGMRVVGLDAIRASFEAIFDKGPVPVQPEGVRRLDTGDTAVHTLFERLDVEAPEGVHTAWAIATNVYARTALGWRMVAHHASPGPAHEPSEIADPPTTLH